MKNLIKRIKSKTPRVWLAISAACGSISLMCAAGYGSVSALSLQMPDWFTKYIGIVVFISGAIAIFAKQKEVKQ